MKFLKPLIYILCIPFLIYFHLFFEYISSISILLLFSIVVFRDLRLLNSWWFVAISSILLDLALYYWLGTFIFTISLTLFSLKLWDRYIGSVLLGFVGIFLSFVFFKIVFETFVSLQESFTLNLWDVKMLGTAIVFGLINMLVYLIIRGVTYILQSYLRDDGLKV